MIDDKVVAAASEFTAFWSNLLSPFPRYALDFSWPSIGILDRILFPLRGVQSLNEADQLMLRGASAYLAGMAYDCWRKFPQSPEVEVLFIDKPCFDIVVRAKGGNMLEEGQQFEVGIYSTLKQILQNPENPFPSFAEEKTLLCAESSLISLFAGGLFSGLCPYGKGPWKEKEPAEFSSVLYRVCEYMAKNSAAYYEKVFPTEEIGASWRLYRANLVLPPPGYDELYPGMRATAGLIDYLKHSEVDEENIAKVALNLAYSPDELQSMAGFSLAAAIYSEQDAEKISALAESKGLSVAALRPAVMLARRMLGRKESWLNCFWEGDFEQAKKLFKIEQSLGLIPLLPVLDLTWPQYQLLDDLLDYLAWSQSVQAREAFVQHSVDLDLPNELLILEVVVDLYSGDLAVAEQHLTKLSEELLVQEPRLYFQYLRLKAELLQRQGNFAQEQVFLQKAWEVGSDNLGQYAAVGSRLAAFFFEAKKFDQVENLCKQVLAKKSGSLSAKTLFCLLLKQRGEQEQLAAELKELTALAPHSPRVFSFLKGYLLEEEMSRVRSA